MANTQRIDGFRVGPFWSKQKRRRVFLLARIYALKRSTQLDPDSGARIGAGSVRRRRNAYSAHQSKRRRGAQQLPQELFAAVADSCQFAHRFPPHQFFVTRIPISFGSVRNTFVVSPLSSLFRKSPVIAVVLKMFLSYSMTCQPFWLVNISVRLTLV